jgi:large repetitive protein
MGGRGTAMKATRKLVTAVAATLLVLAVGPLSTAVADPPTITIDGALAGAFTQDRTPGFSGSTSDAADPVTLDIYEGADTEGLPVQEPMAFPEGGVWNIQAETLADGTYTAVAVQTNLETGEPGQSATVTFTVDNVEPALSLSSVSSPTQNASPTFSGAAGTAPGDSESVTVTVHAGSSVAGSVIAEASVQVSGGAWSSIPAHLADGTYTVQATQGDAAGNTATSTASTFRVDTTGPIVSLGSVSSPTKNASPTFTGAAGAATGDTPSVTVTVYAGAAVGGSVVASTTVPVSGGKWSAIPAHFADGTYTVQATQGDEAGNSGTSTAATFMVDTAAPAVSLNAVAPLTNDATPAFGGSAGSASGDSGTVVVAIRKEGKEVVTEANVTVTGATWSLNAPHLADGTYTVQATQADTAGNTGASSSATFRIDTTSPAVGLTTPANKQALKDENVIFSGNAGHAEGDGSEVTLYIYEAGNPVAIQIVSIGRKGGTSWKSEGPELPAGKYIAQATQSDSAGNIGLSNLNSFTITTDSPSVTLDTSVFTHRKANLVVGSATPHFSTEPAPGLESVTLAVYSGTSTLTKPLEQASMTQQGGAVWSVDLAEHLPDGTYTAQAEVKDLAENTGVSSPVIFTVDTTPPVLTLSTPANGSSAGGETQMIAGSAGLADGDLRSVTVQLFAGAAVAGQPLEEVVVGDEPSGAWSVPLGGLAAGSYTVRAIQRDDVNNEGQSAFSTFTLTGTPLTSAPVPPTPPVASFTWVPVNPAVGQNISLVSNSTDASSPINGFAWDVLGNGPFAAGGPIRTTSFATAGRHTVRLQVSDAIGQASVVAKTIDVTAIPLALMQPFPIVRIAGSETSYGAKVKLLTVQAPIAARVTVTCRGRGCKTKSESRLAVASKNKRIAALLAFHRFERPLKAGVTLQIRVTKAGQIGKYTSFAIRRHKLPVRTDACLRPTSSAPVGCPTS